MTNVAILILVDFTLQYNICWSNAIFWTSRNPYFSGLYLAIWNVARNTIRIHVAILILVDFTLQYSLRYDDGKLYARSQSLF